MSEEIVLIDDLNLTQGQREQHFFNKGYEYALLHLHLGLKAEKLRGLEKVLMKHLNHLEGQKGA